MHGRKAEEALHDSNWIQSRLSAELPDFGSNETRIESCRVYAARGRSADDCGDRYVLKLGNLSGGLADTRILTGRLHATAAAAAADFEAATRLREARISKRVLIPRPLARLADQPRLVLYEFDPWMNLWEYLAERRSLNSLRHSAERFGQALAANAFLLSHSGAGDPLPMKFPNAPRIRYLGRRKRDQRADPWRVRSVSSV